jgi:glucosamine--fructose-6-phosphate aminotransferase (isomerizing)
MCGIVGYVGNQQVVPVIIEGLRRLEYRGYDSAGIAVVNRDHEMQVRRASGKLRNLEEAIRQNPINGEYGLGHTRWATHGRPTEENAHPHRSGDERIVVVHNGIIENYLELKRDLQARGHVFKSETDTEVVAHLIQKHQQLDSQADLETAFRRSLNEVRGIYALVAMSADEPEKIVAARLGPPVVVGLGDDEYFVASDIPAILPHTRNIFFLGDGEIAHLSKDGVRVTDLEGKTVKPQVQRITWDPIQAEKGGYKHFML